MKISHAQLNEVIKLITRQILKEFSTMQSATSAEADSIDSTDATGMDTRTSSEIARDKRQNQIQAKHELDKAKLEKKANKEKADSFKSQYDQWRRYGRPDDDAKIKGLQAKLSGR